MFSCSRLSFRTLSKSLDISSHFFFPADHRVMFISIAFAYSRLSSERELDSFLRRFTTHLITSSSIILFVMFQSSDKTYRTRKATSLMGVPYFSCFKISNIGFIIGKYLTYFEFFDPPMVSISKRA